MTENRRLWLIDAAYLFNARHSVRPQYQFDYLQLRRRLEEDGPIWRSYYLNSSLDAQNDYQDGFHHWLRSGPPNGPGIITKLYPIKTSRLNRAFCARCQQMSPVSCSTCAGDLSTQGQKGVDVGIATLALIHQDKFDTLLLSSGDGDLMDAVEYLSERGKRVELCVFEHGVSTELQARADRIHWINDFADEVGKQERPRAPTA